MASVANWLAFSLLALSPSSRLGQAVQFFVYDSLKIVALLSVVMLVVTMARTWLKPHKVRQWLSMQHAVVGYLGAAILGVATPFCSCSAVPLFIGFVESGVPLGMTFSFLVASPMVNEVALILLFGLFGWKIALLYAATGVAVALAAGVTIGHLRMEAWLQPDARGKKIEEDTWTPTLYERFAYARGSTWLLLKKVMPSVLIGVAIGGWIHGFVPQSWLLRVSGRDNVLAVPMAVLVGVPLYSNAAGIVPVIQALIGKGMPMGTALAFMMAVIALSFPEAVILKKVLQVRLLLAFFGVVAASIMVVGYLFNCIL